MDIRIESLPSAKRKEKPASAQPGFGKVFTDHMLVADWEVGRGWRDARIAPYGPFSLEPAAAVFHYGQEVFEGLKAFRQPDGRIGVFRLEDHLERFNRSAARVALPQVDRELFINGLAELLRLDRDWMPQAENTALYIRPMLFATEPALGVKPAGQCRFCIILSPAGAYCGKTGRLLVEQQMVRAAPTGGNYAASLVAAQKAAARGFDQVLWLDAQHRNIEEAGAMNIRHPGAVRRLSRGHYPRFDSQAGADPGDRGARAADLHRRSHRRIEKRPHQGDFRNRHGSGSLAGYRIGRG